MKDNIVWSPDSIMNIAEDTMSSSSGTVSTSGKNLILEAKSEAVYKYTFDTSDNMIKSSKLRLKLNVKNSDTTVISRYDESVQVELVLQYYKEVINEDGSTSGYELGTIDTYQVNTYFKHETEGYFKNYDLDIEETPLVFIEVKFINTSNNKVTFLNPLVINSMTIMDAITTYGGGGESGGGEGGGSTPGFPVLNDLMLYSTNGSYDINYYDGALKLKLAIPEKYLIGTTSSKPLKVKWSSSIISGSPSYYYSASTEEIFYNDVRYWALNNTVLIEGAYGNGTFKIRAEITDSSTGSVVYDEKTITIKNCNLTDVSMEVLDPEGKIRGCYGTKVRFTLNNNLGNIRGTRLNISVESYDGGQLDLKSFNNGYYKVDVYINDNIGEVVIGGIHDGKAKIIVEPYDDNTYPKSFRKEFIVDVVEATPRKIYLTADKTEIRSHNDIVNLTITSDTGTLLSLGKSKIRINYTDNGKLGKSGTSGYIDYIPFAEAAQYAKFSTAVFGIDIGKAILIAETSVIDHSEVFTSDPIEIDITFADEPTPTSILESSTGEFSINKGGGQLVLTPIPDYNWYGNYTYSKLSIDGGNCDISTSGTEGMNNCIVTATKNGTVRIIAKPTYGPSIEQDILITGQYPEDVALSVDTNTNKMIIGTSLIVRAKASNTPNPSYYKFRWDYQYLDTTSSASFTTKDNSTAYQVTGKELGRILVRCMDYNNYEVLDTMELEVVETLE